jgi:hypothetical protein
MLFIIPFSAMYIGCYSVDIMRFQHENFSQSGNPYDDHRNYNIIPYYFDDKAFLVAIHGSYAYDSTLFWLKDKSYTLVMDVSIYSEEGINNITINACEVVFDDFTIIFDENELNNLTTRTSTNAVKPFLRNYVYLEKEIDIKILNNYIKRKIRNNPDPQFIMVNIDVNYEENGEIKNWISSTRFYIKLVEVTYTPKNAWGAF